MPNVGRLWVGNNVSDTLVNMNFSSIVQCVFLLETLEYTVGHTSQWASAVHFGCFIYTSDDALLYSSDSYRARRFSEEVSCRPEATFSQSPCGSEAEWLKKQRGPWKRKNWTKENPAAEIKNLLSGSRNLRKPLEGVVSISPKATGRTSTQVPKRRKKHEWKFGKHLKRQRAFMPDVFGHDPRGILLWLTSFLVGGDHCQCSRGSACSFGERTRFCCVLSKWIHQKCSQHGPGQSGDHRLLKRCCMPTIVHVRPRSRVKQSYRHIL